MGYARTKLEESNERVVQLEKELACMTENFRVTNDAYVKLDANNVETSRLLAMAIKERDSALSERDELKVSESGEHFYEGVGGVYHARVLELRQERDALKAKLEAAERADHQPQLLAGRDKSQEQHVRKLEAKLQASEMTMGAMLTQLKEILSNVTIPKEAQHAIMHLLDDYEDDPWFSPNDWKELNDKLITANKENEQLRKACGDVVELMRWMDRTGGLGMDVHNRLRDFIDLLSALVKEDKGNTKTKDQWLKEGGSWIQ